MYAEDGTVTGAIEIFSDDSAQTESRRKTEAMSRLAFLDHLTHLPNRRFLEMSLDTAFVEYQTHKDPFGIVALDLDGFKAINDTFGHSWGDRVLREVAKTLAGCLRQGDVLGRWGGDEFLAIIRNVNRDELQQLSERCVVMIYRTSLPVSEKTTISLSISAGASLVRSGENSHELMVRADELMYRSKTEGRNRTTTD